MFCPNCGKTVPDSAKFCGSCGKALIDAGSFNIGAQQPEQPAQPVQPVEPVQPVQPIEPDQPEQPVQRSFFPQQETRSTFGGPEQDTVRQAFDSGFEEQPGQSQYGGYGYPPTEPVQPAQPEPPKKKKGLLIGGIIAAVIIIAAVAIALNFKAVSNAVMRTFASPESYYRHVEKQSLGDTIDSAMDIYDNTIYDNLAADKRTVTANATITVSEPARELIASLSNMDMAWLEQIDINEVVTMADGKMGINMDAALNGVAIATAEIVTEDEDIYFRVPEIRDDYAKLDQQDTAYYGVSSSYQDILSTLVQHSSEILPESNKLSKILNRYVDIYTENVDEVEKGSDTLEAGSVSQKYTTLTVNLKGDDLAEIIKAVCETAMEDDDLKEIITSAAKAAEEDPDNAWDGFVRQLENTKDNADSIGDRTEIEMTVYVDGKGDIRGRTIVIDDYTKLEYAAPEKGSEYGILLAMSEDGTEQYAFEGDGKGKEGSFVLKVQGLHILDITAEDFNKDDLKKGYLNGSFDVSLSSFVSGQLGSMANIPALRGLDLRDAHLTLDSKASKDKSSFTLRLMLGDDEYLAISGDSKASNGGKVEVPEDGMSAQDWVQKINATNLDTILDHLEDAGVPDNLLRMLFHGN